MTAEVRRQGRTQPLAVPAVALAADQPGAASPAARGGGGRLAKLHWQGHARKGRAKGPGLRCGRHAWTGLGKGPITLDWLRPGREDWGAGGAACRALHP